MSEVIRWKELDDKEKIRLILEHVMQWQFYETYRDFSDNITKKIYPVAFWDDNNWNVFYDADLLKMSKIFDPLHRIESAWQIVEKLRQHQRFASFEMMINPTPLMEKQ